VEVTVAVDGVAAEDRWPGAPLVVVGADRVVELARRGLPRRMGVLLIAERDRTDDPALWPWADALYVEHIAVLPEARDWLVGRFAEHGPSSGLRAAARAATVAIVGGSRGAKAGELAMAVAVTACGQGCGALLIGASALPVEIEPTGAGGSLAMLSLERLGEASVAPEAMAAALRAGRSERDFVVVDLPHSLDAASLLALTSADRGCLVVVAEVRACAAATRVAATVRRHCPALGLVVRAVRPRGLRPVEVAQALDLPLLGVIPPDSLPGRAYLPLPGNPLTRLGRRLLADLDLRPRPTAWAQIGAGGWPR
jgi:hypothetical protein